MKKLVISDERITITELGEVFGAFMPIEAAYILADKNDQSITPRQARIQLNELVEPWILKKEKEYKEKYGGEV